MTGKTTAEELLQRQAERTERAAEVIDRDPAEAHAILAERTTATDGSPITMQDIFGLFSRLQSQVMALAERQAAQQEQMISVLTNQQKIDGKARRDTEEELKQAALQKEMTLEAWRTEPREPVWIQPEISEEKIHAVMNAYPPRVFRVNGLEFPIAVGEVVNVPQSVAALVRHSQKQRPMARGPQGIPEIPDPRRAQFLAGSQEVTVGRPGTTGEGYPVLTPAAASASQAQPLDVRYDQFGR